MAVTGGVEQDGDGQADSAQTTGKLDSNSPGWTKRCVSSISLRRERREQQQWRRQGSGLLQKILTSNGGVHSNVVDIVEDSRYGMCPALPSFSSLN
jgi:hypothetical protein